MQTAQGIHKSGLRISDASCSNLPRIGILLKHSGSFLLQATIAGITRRTHIAEPSNSPSWDEPLDFDVDEDGQLIIQIINQHRPGNPKTIGQLILPTEIVRDLKDARRFPEQPLTSKNKRVGVVSFTLTRLNHLDVLEPVHAQTRLATASASKIEKAGKVPSALGHLNGVDEAIEKGAASARTWEPLIYRVELLVTIGNSIAEIHPYAQMAWSVLSPALKAIDEQRERDEQIVELLTVMNDAYDFVDATRPLKIEDLGGIRKEIVKKMLQQTYECAWFVRDYTSQGFLSRTWNGVTTNHDSIVQQYIHTFTQLKTRFQDESSVKVEITVHRTLALAQEIYDTQLLNDMAYARGQDLAQECLPGTREAILTEIVEWVNRPFVSLKEPAPCVYWLHGVAGCGKSAIAATIAQQFRGVNRCAWYFFDASRQIEAGPQQMFSTLSRMLADMDAKWRESLVKIVKPSRQLQTTLNVKEQFENFILEPAKEFEPMGPILVVIDAIDESGSKEGRANLLQMLARLGELGKHGHFRFFITSRLEDDIQKVFESKPWAVCQDLTHANESSTNDDIRRYVDAELSQEPELAQEFDKKPVDLVVERAEHLFQWAVVACSYIRGTGESGVDPVERYVYLRDDHTDARLDKLDELYARILRGLYGSGERNDKIARFRKVLGRILSAREPLSMEALTELRSKGEGEREIERIACSLGSLLKGVRRDSRHEPIQPLHASFVEFLFDSERSGEFHIEARSGDAILAQSSLRVMNDHLRFNICNLETSYVRNQDIRDLSVRVQQNIPEWLAYACRHFAEHLGACKPDAVVDESLRTFLEKKLLFWLEALGLLKDISQALEELLTLQTWVERTIADQELEIFIGDTIRFVRIYGGAMEMSTPHLYLSSLAFVPLDSPLYDKYARQYPGKLEVASVDGQSVRWTSMLLYIKNAGRANSIEFSHDGKLVAAGFYDSTVWVWNAHIGHLVAGPFQGHTGIVRSVAFSPDNKLVVSASNDMTIRVWDVRMGRMVTGPIQGHASGVISARFSPDGKLIVSGSFDGSVRVWETSTGQLVVGSLEGHTRQVTSVRFSLDGKLLVSGSSDMTARIWNARTGQLVAGPLQGHAGWVTSVEFSPDNKLVVSASGDSTLRVWDAQTGQMVAGPIQGHTGGVTSVAFSPDGKFIVSGSIDQTVRIWDVRTGQQVASPLQGHIDWIVAAGFSSDGKLIFSASGNLALQVWEAPTRRLASDLFQDRESWATSVMLSPDCRLIASNALDNTIRVWDAYTGRFVSGPFQGHTLTLSSMEFSSDGKLIVASSYDTTIRVWDVHTGLLVAGPLQGGTCMATATGFSPDSKLIVSGDTDGTIRVWGTYTGQLVSSLFQGHASRISSIAFSPDGKLIVSGSYDTTIRVWDVHTAQLVADPFQGHAHSVTSVTFSPDGTLVASSSYDKTVRLWDVYTGQPVGDPFHGHNGDVTLVGFLPNGKFIISSSTDNTIRIWNIRTGQAVGVLRCHYDSAMTMGFPPDGNLVVSATDENIRIWDIKPYTTLSPDNSFTNAVPILESETHEGLGSSKNETPSSQSPVPYTDSSEMDDDGWMLGSSGELLFWVPPSYRRALWRPSNVAVIGTDSLKLNVTRLAHGSAWCRCREP